MSIYPTNSRAEGRLFHELGEVGYDRYCYRLAMEFVRKHPDEVAVLTLMKIRDWWLGQGSEWSGHLKLGFQLSTLKRLSWLLPLPFFVYGCIAAWRNHIPIGLLLGVFLLYPVPYYFTIVTERYHFPIEPLLLLLGAYGLIQVGRRLFSFPEPSIVGLPFVEPFGNEYIGTMTGVLALCHGIGIVAPDHVRRFQIHGQPIEFARLSRKDRPVYEAHGSP